VPLGFVSTQISLTVAAKELSVSDTDVSEVSWTDNGTFNLSEGYTPQTDTSDGIFFLLLLNTCKNIQLLPTTEWIYNMWCISTLDYYLDVKVNTHTCFSMDEPSKLYAK
jgi:hypothetical protein